MVTATLPVTPKTLHYPFFCCHCILNFTLKPVGLFFPWGDAPISCAQPALHYQGAIIEVTAYRFGFFPVPLRMSSSIQ